MKKNIFPNIIHCNKICKYSTGWKYLFVHYVCVCLSCVTYVLELYNLVSSKKIRPRSIAKKIIHVSVLYLMCIFFVYKRENLCTHFLSGTRQKLGPRLLHTTHESAVRNYLASRDQRFDPFIMTKDSQFFFQDVCSALQIVYPLSNIGCSKSKHGE